MSRLRLFGLTGACVCDLLNRKLFYKVILPPFHSHENLKEYHRVLILLLISSRCIFTGMTELAGFQVLTNGWHPTELPSLGVSVTYTPGLPQFELNIVC